MVTTTYYIIPGSEKKRIRGNKKEQVPKTSKKKKVRREVKMDKCPTTELGVQDTHLREKKKKEKKNIEHLILLKKLQSTRKVCIPSKEQK